MEVNCLGNHIVHYYCPISGYYLRALYSLVVQPVPMGYYFSFKQNTPFNPMTSQLLNDGFQYSINTGSFKLSFAWSFALILVFSWSSALNVGSLGPHDLSLSDFYLMLVSNFCSDVCLHPQMWLSATLNHRTAKNNHWFMFTFFTEIYLLLSSTWPKYIISNFPTNAYIV